MPIIRYWSAQNEHGGMKITVQFEAPFYEELLVSNGGCFTRDFEVHALWDYYGCALKAHDMAKRNLVEESELSRVFDAKIARQLFIGIANKHGVRPDKMVRFWPMVERQRIAMGGTDFLPQELQFRYWGN